MEFLMFDYEGHSKNYIGLNKFQKSFRNINYRDVMS